MNQENNNHTVEKPVKQYKPAYTSNYSDEAWEIRVALPGVSKQDLNVTVENEILEISALRKIEVPEGWKRLNGSDHDKQYRLRLDVGPEVDDQGIQAKLDNGELLIQLPLREEAKPRLIPIR